MMRGYELHHIDGDRVYRFVRIERLIHWVNALSFFTLAVTGVIMLLRKPLSLSEGSISFLHQGHVYVGAVYFFGPALIFLIGDWRAGLHWTFECFRWTLGEILWLMGPARKLLFPRTHDPLVGRFNAGQRLNMLGQLFGKWGVAITGYYMHQGHGHLLLYDFHVLLFILLLLLVAGHIYMGLINPSTRHARFAMMRGFVDFKWLAHHHPGWIAKLPNAARAAEADSSSKEEAGPSSKEAEQTQKESDMPVTPFQPPPVRKATSKKESETRPPVEDRNDSSLQDDSKSERISGDKDGETSPAADASEASQQTSSKNRSSLKKKEKREEEEE